MKKAAFSLMELLIVVIIIGVVYTLAVSSFQNLGEKSSRVTLENLREYLKSFKYEKSVKFLCLDECSSCNIYVDGKLNEETKGVFDKFLDKSVKLYRYDFSLGMQTLENEIYFNSENVEEAVCFSYEIDKKGIGKQMFVEYKNRVYDFTTYFEKTPVYNSLQEIVITKEFIASELLK